MHIFRNLFIVLLLIAALGGSIFVFIMRAKNNALPSPDTIITVAEEEPKADPNPLKRQEESIVTTSILFTDISLLVEIVNTPRTRRQGLSGREAFSEGEGMLFVFEESAPHSFWMKDMKFPLDIIWFDENRAVVDMAFNALPEGSNPKKIYEPDQDARYVLEVLAGFATKNGIVRGDRFFFCKDESCAEAEITDRDGGDTPQEDVSTGVGHDEREEEDTEAEEEKKETVLPLSILHPVPFTPQAPFGNWADPRQQDGCEEASIIMAYHWITGEELTRENALTIIREMSAYELETYGYYQDTSVEDTAKLFEEYYEGVSLQVITEVDEEAIKNALAAENVVIVPVNGRALNNPYFTPPGPLRHMLVIVGYDDEKSEFITNDPGTRRGEGFRYNYEIFVDAIRDYPSGHNVPGTDGAKVMIVVGK